MNELTESELISDSFYWTVSYIFDVFCVFMMSGIMEWKLAFENLQLVWAIIFSIFQ